MNAYLIPSIRIITYITIAMVIGWVWSINTGDLTMGTRFAYASIFCGIAGIILFVVAMVQEQNTNVYNN